MKNFKKISAVASTLVLGWSLSTALLAKEVWTDYYTLEDIPTPAGLDPQVGGMDFMPDGRLAVCFHRGEIYTYQPETGEWRLFAEGLQEPLGLVAVSDSEVVVVQRPEMTRIVDLDMDGVADLYSSLYDGFGMTGNYHEFAFGPIQDNEGNFYISLNLASSGASVRKEVRGEFIDIGLPREKFYSEPWRDVQNIAGRMYSRTPYRGWVLNVSPEGEMTPIAPGFRSPNGMGFDLEGRLHVTDNQGDWLGTSKCFHVEPGKFYRHPASLVWKEGWTRDPLEIPVDELESMRTRAAYLFPQNVLANSPTQPLCDTTEGKFGPFAGQMLVGEMNVARLLRLTQDVVQGRLQGAAIPVLDGGPLNIGLNRLVFDDAGSLYIGQTALSWAGSKGIQKVTWTGKTPLEVHNVHLTCSGFEIEFTKPVTQESITAENALKIKSYYFKYHRAYGSPQVDQQPALPESMSLSSDGKTLSVRLKSEDLKAGYVYEMDFDGLKTSEGQGMLNTKLCYNLVVLQP